MLSSELVQLNGETKEEFRPIEFCDFSEEFFLVGKAIFGTAGWSLGDYSKGTGFTIFFAVKVKLFEFFNAC